MATPGMLKEQPRTRTQTRDSDLRTRSPRSLERGPAIPRRKLHAAPVYRGRLGSQQKVSVRGRRVSPIKAAPSRSARLVFLGVVLFIAGIAAAMLFSGMSTESSFQVREATAKSTALGEEITTLERDVEKAKSAQNLSAHAAEEGMVVPGQPGILETDGKKVTEKREADKGKDRDVIDVTSPRHNREATSAPEETANVPGLAPSSPAGAAAANNLISGDVPYSNPAAPQP